MVLAIMKPKNNLWSLLSVQMWNVREECKTRGIIDHDNSCIQMEIHKQESK